MSQADFNIANQGFPATRAELNDSLQALASNSSGATEPNTTYSNQWWFDTTTDILKIRNVGNSAWVDFATIDSTTGDISFVGPTTFSDTITVDSNSAYVELNDTDNLASESISAAVRMFDSAGTEVGHIGRLGSPFLRVQSNDGPVHFESDHDSLDDVEETYSFLWNHRQTTLATLSNAGDFESKRLRLTSTADVTLSSENHAFGIGDATGINLAMDNNEIQARNNGAAGGLGINTEGGNVNVGGGSSIVEIRGRLTVPFGTSGAPSLTFDGDDDTGIYRISGNTLGVVGSGDIRARFDSTGTGTTNGQTVMTRQKGDARYQSSSLSILKDEQVPAYADSPLVLLNQLQPKQWVWNDNLPEGDERIGRNGAGLVVEEVQSIIPEAVTWQWNDDGDTETGEGATQSPRGLDPMAFVALLISSVQQQQTQIETLVERVSQLEG
ncbi:MAG: tail fiber domain-containing protein [Pseudoalteromonas sp.]|uniref:hypothetical protein n=1 Tax=Pseudoalteromonas sp. TaxID=53249 RepID=UPI001DB775C4|nr:hypothetical protein [Pseudoalteromonas sp.]NRA77818.1 tail fiber domain-containing protein [Pseudoalteromonas sp.]